MARESDLPEGVRDIIGGLSPDLKQTVLDDYEERYAPFLALLSGWKSAVRNHYEAGERSAIARLEREFFPIQAWRFPSQTLAIPSAPPAERTVEIAGGAEFRAPGSQKWTPSGSGWVQPTTLGDASRIYQVDGDRVVLVDVQFSPQVPPEGRAGIAARGQLVFVCAPENMVGALASATWWASVPQSGGNRAAQTWQPARCVRWEGYGEFEREMQTSRLSQRQLDQWLPPFLPYGRKILLLRLATPEEIALTKDADVPPFDMVANGGNGEASLQFGAWLPAQSGQNRTVSRWERSPAGRAVSSGALFLPNPIPLLRAQVEEIQFPPPFERVGREYVFGVSDVPAPFAAVVYHQDAFDDGSGQDGVLGRRVPATLLVKSGDENGETAEIRTAQPESGSEAASVLLRVYHSAGDGNRDIPAFWERPPLRFHAPFPPLGGKSVDSPATRAEAVREAWYHTTLRPSLLTEGDLFELIRQRTHLTDTDGLLTFTQATRSIASSAPSKNRGDAVGTPWNHYLWPSVIARARDLNEVSGIGSGTGFVPLDQVLTLHFSPGPKSGDVPFFLLDDAAQWLASSLSLYFAFGCFRVEGRVT